MMAHILFHVKAACPGSVSTGCRTSRRGKGKVHNESLTLIADTNDFEDLLQLEQIILDFQETYERAAKPFEWKFSRKDLRNVLNNFDSLRVPKKRAA